MKYTYGFIVLALIAIAAADTGTFVPRAFYTIDANGEPSPISPINAYNQQRILHRLRRANQGFSSSSSSSSSVSSQAGPNAPVVWQSSSVMQVGNSPTSSGFGLADRFGPDEPSSGNTFVQQHSSAGHYDPITGQVVTYYNHQNPRPHNTNQQG